jgi:hypothetical protein
MELTVNKDFLMALFNEARFKDHTFLMLHSPMLELDLVKVSLATDRFIWIISREEFEDRLSALKVRLGSDRLIYDLPTYGDLRDAFLNSLLVRPENLRDLMVEIDDIEMRKLDPYRYPKQKVIAIDTNIAYHRLLTRLLVFKGCPMFRDFDPSNVQVLIPSLVEAEISEKVRRKYDFRDLKEYGRIMSTEVTSNLANCVMKDGRKALNAQTELRKIKEHYTHWDVNGGEFDQDKEKRDDEIVKALADHAASQRIEVIFLTADDKARAHAYAHKVPSICLKYPYTISENVELDPWLLPELLYELAIVFGVISLKGHGIRVMGEWAGKTAEDYLDERVKLSMDDRSAFAGALARDHRIISRLQEELDLRGMR